MPLINANLLLQPRSRPRTVYEAFGLRLSSEISLPELSKAAVDGAVSLPTDVVIARAEPDELWGELRQAGNNFVRIGNRFLFLIPDTAIYCIEEGARIFVAPLAGADAEKVRVYLLGTCMGALLMLRRTLPLHGSAVVIDGRAYAFLGDSGVGKSTLAAALVHRGYSLLSDDVIAARPYRHGNDDVMAASSGQHDAEDMFTARSSQHDNNVIAASSGQHDADAAIAAQTGERSRLPPLVMPAYPQQKLWRASLDGLGLAAGRYQPVYRETDKFAVPLPESAGFCDTPVPLGGIFELAQAGQGTAAVRTRELSSLERLKMLQLHTYRNLLIRRLGLERWHFRASADIAARVPMYRLSRPIEGFTAHRLAAAIIRIATKENR